MVQQKSILSYLIHPKVIIISIICISIISLYILNLFDIQKRSFFIFSIKTPSKKLDYQKYDIFTPGCRITYMNPFNKSITEFIEKVHLVCSDKPSLIKSNDTHLIVVNDAFKFYNIGNTLNCSYQNFWRVAPNEDQRDTIVEYEKEEHFFNLTIKVDQEFLRIKCYGDTKEIYQDFHSFVPTKVNQKSREKKAPDQRLNVIILGLDAVSRLNFHRQLPKTLDYLLHNLSATEFFGYNKVGDNTFPNLIPLLSGLSEPELIKTCWPNDDKKFDDCDFIWQNFNQSGYVTAFAEDSTWMGLFTYTRRGFRNQPTTHYWTPYNYEVEDKIGTQQHLNAKMCIGSRMVYESLLEYTLKYINAYQRIGQKHFGFFWGTGLSHDDLNYPSLGDANYKNLLENIKESKALNDTILLVLSDHGIRWGGIMDTHQGRMEVRLPFLYIVLPLWFEDKYPLAKKNLEENARRLTTPFDVHETLLDIANQDFSGESLSNASRGISLFREIPVNRTCNSAGIPAHWCTCQEPIPVDIKNKTISKVVNFTLNILNNKFKNFTNCAHLSLSSIVDADVSMLSFDVNNNITKKYYTVNFYATPGLGLFEAMVSCYNCEDVSSYQMAGSVSRHNLYGHQSYCVNDAELKLYCYCKN